MIPITIITGFLGSGKTTLILNLIPQLPPTYKLALLKNEYGDVAVDSQLATSSAISGVQELLNGCICCNLVGQLSDALATLSTDINPDRIVIETSGSAFPATLAMEVNRLARETGQYVLDGVLSVIDVENWKGERRLEDVEDAILALEVEPQIPRTKSKKGWVGKEIVFGLDARGVGELDGQQHEHDHGHSSEIEVLSVTLKSGNGGGSLDIAKFAEFLAGPTKDEVYRIKGCASSDAEQDAHRKNPEGRARYILNWAFGRWTFTPVAATDSVNEPELRLTVMTARYESNKWKKEIESRGLLRLEGEDAGALTVEKIQ
ncbi:hypothetical protein SNOG_03479 [Parastagonospora nodorum SN15]|uniref:CobW/HypB/UreG nucleotide-binding domain-containing protein n=1 Tax=Phaeosphaeria nodorum (strain SN15 / ATCC MYA-4574 / FGSC 10173) TaxID=321614 RepID=Q0UXN5_PHANO|nr:hypothetical protein SNOG_03479 [Parastagonospora nodorum SN15]EAT88684.2 hypothetical protein SNOG_03479 [Parastagonospora nodorum SN15]